MTESTEQSVGMSAAILATPLEPDPATGKIVVTKAYRYAIDPTPAQAQQLQTHVGGSRYEYNTMSGKLYENWNQIEMEKEAGGQQTKYLPTDHFGLLVQKRVQSAVW